MIKLIQIRAFNVKDTSAKLLEENTAEYLHNIRVDEDFYTKSLN